MVRFYGDLYSKIEDHPALMITLLHKEENRISKKLRAIRITRVVF